jgi:hypothetical protein
MMAPNGMGERPAWSTSEAAAVERLVELQAESGQRPAEVALASLEQALDGLEQAGRPPRTEGDVFPGLGELVRRLEHGDREAKQALREALAVARRELNIPPPSKALEPAHACAFRDAHPVQFLSTALETLDRFTLGGLWDERLHVVAGEPNVGKTALAVQLAGVACESGSAVAIHASDVDKRADIAARIGVARGVSRAALRRCDKEAQGETQAILKKWSLIIADQFADEIVVEDTIDALLQLGRASGARRLVLVVDSLQTAACRALFGPGAPRFEKERIEATCRALLIAARRGVLVLCTSEVPRNFYSNKALDQPSDMAAVKGSGRVEFALWTLLVLRRRRGEEPNTFHLGMPKNKGGQPEGAMLLKYAPELGLFTDAGEVPYETRPGKQAQKKREQEDQATFDARLDAAAHKMVPELVKKLLSAGKAGMSLRKIRQRLTGKSEAKDRAAEIAVEAGAAVTAKVKGRDVYFAPSMAPNDEPPPREEPWL